MDLFKKGRGRPSEKEKGTSETQEEKLPEGSIDFDSVEESTTTQDEVNATERIEALEEQLKMAKVEYEKLYVLYSDLKKKPTAAPAAQVPAQVVASDDFKKLEAQAKSLHKRFQDIATGNNKFKTKYDSVRILGLNGVLDEIRKHFPTTNFSK